MTDIKKEATRKVVKNIDTEDIIAEAIWHLQRAKQLLMLTDIHPDKILSLYIEGEKNGCKT